VLEKMSPLGLLGRPITEKYGGIGIDYVSHALVTEEIGRADSSVRTTLSVQISLVELTILKFGTEEQKQRWLPKLCKGELIGCFGLTEPEVGSDAAKLRTTAKRDGNAWILRGRKMWISNGSVSNLALVFAQADPDKCSKGISASRSSSRTWSSRRKRPGSWCGVPATSRTRAGRTRERRASRSCTRRRPRSARRTTRSRSTAATGSPTSSRWSATGAMRA